MQNKTDATSKGNLIPSQKHNGSTDRFGDSRRNLPASNVIKIAGLLVTNRKVSTLMGQEALQCHQRHLCLQLLRNLLARNVNVRIVAK